MTPLVGPGLDLALNRLLYEYRTAQFVWGESDCTIFALDWLDRVTGSNELEGVRWQYASDDEAREFHRAGGRTLADVLIQYGASLVERGVSYAQRGDFLLVPDKHEPWFRCHICTGRDFASIWPNRGLRLIPMRMLPAETQVWRCAPCLP